VLIVAFAVAGFSKLIPAVRNIMQKHFNFMAPWTWNTIAVWEIGLGVIYHFLGFKAFALNMAFMLLGGALWATNFQSKGHYPVSILRQTYGVALLPPLFGCLLTSCVAYHDQISIRGAPLAVFIGILFGTVITKK
jgi:hypothetical protein